MSPLVLLLASLPVLALNYRWALLDPHRADRLPSWTACALTALWASALLLVALVLAQQGHGRAGALLGSFAFGTAISPSIAPPYVLDAVEEPRPLRRFAVSRLHGMRVVSIKMLLLLPASFLVGLVVEQDSSFFASALIAVFFSLVKAAYMADLSRGRARRVIRLAAGGTAWLLLWLGLAFPLMDLFPEPALDDYWMVTAFVFGVLLRPG